MSVRDAVQRVHGAIDPAAALADVRRLCELDRYQSSAGLAEAAAYVAERAETAGLSDVRVLSFPADGRTRWWTWASPPGWTPLGARLALASADRPLRTVLSVPEQPYGLAAYSAPTPPGGVLAPLRRVSTGDDPRGAVLLVDVPGHPGAAIAAAAAAGAVAVVADALPGRVEPDQVGRLELPPGSPLAGFSVTASQLHGLVNWARTGGWVHVSVDASGEGALPVVTGVLPGTGPDELLLSAHLCHPRPSANDNASGVAALLALVAALDRPSRLGVRFVWGPEFLGLAAYLHGAEVRPLAAVNVDMAGQDQVRCGGPLVVERSPDDRPSYLNAAVEAAAAAIPPAVWSYSGAVGCDTWAWRATPFVGASDHLMVVEPPVGRPAVSLGHWPDRFNHSSADTVDKVDPEELRRTATVAGAAVATIRAAADGEPEALLDATVGWVSDRLVAAPSAAALAHRAEVGIASVRSLRELGANPDDAVHWVADLATTLRRRPGLAEAPAAPAPPVAAAGVGPAAPAAAEGGAAAAPAVGGGVLRRNWEGPFNLRAVGPGFEELLAADRGGAYARIVALARALDGHRDRDAVRAYAEQATGLPIPSRTADVVLSVLERAGWAVPAGGEAES